MCCNVETFVRENKEISQFQKALLKQWQIKISQCYLNVNENVSKVICKLAALSDHFVVAHLFLIALQN